MDDLLLKLRYKDQSRIAVINAPDEFEKRISKLLPEVQIDKDINARFLYEFMVVFATGSEKVRELGPSCLHNLSNDGKLWIAYPKGTSKKYNSDINRDRGWEPVEEGGFKRVSQVGIDDDWSALRFRNVKYVKSVKKEQ